MTITRSESPLLRLENVHSRYGRKIHALKGVGLEVRTGEIVALIGNNGAGKTTLMKTIAGLMRPEKGKIHFKDEDLCGLAPCAIVRLGLSLVPEGRRVFARLTVMENLEMGAYTRTPGAELDADYARVFDLFPVLDKRRAQIAGTLSGGEQQMLAIGRALMAAPKMLMLDEPSMGLAPVMVDRIFETIARINSEGATILLVEQNARRALRASSRAYVLETGEVAAEGASEVLLEDRSLRRAYLGLD